MNTLTDVHNGINETLKEINDGPVLSGKDHLVLLAPENETINVVLAETHYTYLFGFSLRWADKNTLRITISKDAYSNVDMEAVNRAVKKAVIKKQKLLRNPVIFAD